MDIPLYVFTNRNLSPLEAVCVYLKEEKSMSDTGIAFMLKRDNRTIWTILNRANKKKGGLDVRS